MDFLDRYGRKRVYIVLAIVLIIAHLIVLFYSISSNKSFKLDGEKFTYSSHEEDLIVFKDGKDNSLKVIIEDKSAPLPPDAFANKYRIEYKGETIRVDYSDWLDGDAVISLPNSKEYRFEYLRFHYYPPSDGPREALIIKGIEEVYYFVKYKPLSLAPFFAILFILLGSGLIIYPEKFWKFEHMFTVKGGEPTDWAIFSGVITGILLVSIAIFLPLLANQ